MIIPKNMSRMQKGMLGVLILFFFVIFTLVFPDLTILGIIVIGYLAARMFMKKIGV